MSQPLKVQRLPRIHSDRAIGAAVLVAAALAAFIASLFAGEYRQANDHASGELMVGIGLFAFAGGALNWKWFMSNRRAGVFRALFGYPGARIAYGIIGGAFFGVGLTWMT